ASKFFSPVRAASVNSANKRVTSSSSRFAFIFSIRSICFSRTTVLSISKISIDRKSTRLNSSHVSNSYAVFCLKKKMIVKSKDVCDGGYDVNALADRCAAVSKYLVLHHFAGRTHHQGEGTAGVVIARVIKHEIR